MINSVNSKVKFDLDTFIQNELPITYNFFDGADNKEYRQDLEDLFKYVSENKDNIRIDETLRNKLGLKCNMSYNFAFKKALN